MRTILFARAACLLGLALPAASSAQSPEPWKWPDKPANLKVLPKDFNGERLHAVMRGFTRSLGVRCVHCHVGQDGKPLSSFDFASDQNPNKERAREMYRMLGDINGHLKKIQPSGEKRVNMWCHTCHQGRPRPTTLEEELDAARQHGGVPAALARFRELKERYFGNGGYDFSEGSLNDYGYERLEAKDFEGAIAVLRLNTDEHPASGNAWDSLGEAYLAAGKKELARISYSKSLELDPDNGNAIQKLQELEGAAH